MSYRKKNRILIVSFLILLYVVYHFSVKKTIEHKYALEELVKEKKLLDNASFRITNLQNRNKSLTEVLEKSNISVSNSFEQILLQKINNLSEKLGLNIVSFNKPHVFQEKNIKTTTYIFELKGSYKLLLEFLNLIDGEGLGKIESTSFEKRKDYQKNNYYIILKIFLKKRE